MRQKQALPEASTDTHSYWQLTHCFHQLCPRINFYLRGRVKMGHCFLHAAMFLVVLLFVTPPIHAFPLHTIDSHVSRRMQKLLVSRRDWIQNGLISSGMLSLEFVDTFPAHSADLASSSPEREALLQAISSKSSDDIVLKCIETLVAMQSNQPNKNVASLVDRVDGRWKLIWSIKDDKFSPLLQLPEPFKPSSYQYVGSAAAPIVGDGRIAQLLTNGILGPSKTWLSSGIQEYSQTTLQIQPPFRLEIETSLKRLQIVEAGSDADFRAINVRSTEAQLAPPNLYQQLYVEDIGPGSLRISKIVEGDPVIVGATFVHIKL